MTNITHEDLLKIDNALLDMYGGADGGGVFIYWRQFLSGIGEVLEKDGESANIHIQHFAKGFELIGHIIQKIKEENNLN